MSDFIDPLNDPRFPDRPSHPDFWRLSESAMHVDGLAVEGKRAVFEIVDCDEASFMYMAKARVQFVLDNAGTITRDSLRDILTITYIDAFALAQHFEKAGGHQP